MCRWCATYRWKALEERYNFALDLISIGGLHTKLWSSKVAEVPTLGISGQNTIWMWQTGPKNSKEGRINETMKQITRSLSKTPKKNPKCYMGIL
jgi:hypothetical protein